ncbi:MAG: helix-turn-helix domain-containing protein [Oscillospiraceae bacterium]|nr:helix-turn-helix domain-containing protein [Oscillospiraceae bacterium]
MNSSTAEKLTALRTQKGITQAELAQIIGVDTGTVAGWESADITPDTVCMVRLAQYYNVSLDSLFEINSSAGNQRSPISLDKPADSTGGFVPNGGMRTAYPQNSARSEIYPQGYGAAQQNYSQPGHAYNGAAGSGIPNAQPGQLQDRMPAQNAVQYQPQNAGQNPAQFQGQNTGPVSAEPDRMGQYFNYETADANALAAAGQRRAPSTSFSDEIKNTVSRIQKDRKYHSMLMKFPYPLIALSAFLAGGGIFNLWHPLWMLFLTIPLYYTAIEAVYKKNANIFCYPVLVTLLYLIAGFALNFWHPGWLMFLSIPFYYWIVNFFGKNDSDDDDLTGKKF